MLVMSKEQSEVIETGTYVTELASPVPSVETVEVKKSVAREYFESAVVTVIMALFGMTFVIQAVKVPTGSMQNNILIGDHLLVNKFVFRSTRERLSTVFPFRPVRRGDVIVFKFPEDPQTNYVKRVIGLPGDLIEVRGIHVLVNGQELPEHRLFASRPSFDANDSSLQVISEEPGTQSAKYTVYWEPRHAQQDWSSPSFHDGRYGVGGPYRVPEGHYFAMGDNRDDSEDSRFWGTVPRENIIGRALVVYWSYDEKAAERGGNLLANLFRFTRWTRSGKLIH